MLEFDNYTDLLDDMEDLADPESADQFEEEEDIDDQFDEFIDNVDPAKLADYEQVEYVLYGSSRKGTNCAAMFATLFALRFGVRFLEGLIINAASAPLPWVWLTKAAVYAVKMSLKDMKLLLMGNTANLSRFIPIQVSYEFYLRLFLLVHPCRPTRLSRMQAIISDDVGEDGVDLRKRPVSIEVRADSRTELKMVPWITRMMQAFSEDVEAVDEYKLKMEKRAGMHY